MEVKTLIHNIKGICLAGQSNFLKGKQMNNFNLLENAWLIIQGDVINSYGSMSDFPNEEFQNMIDAKNGYLIPSFIDSHTHIVFAKWREEEYMMRLNGKSYEEIAEAGGGILNSAKKLQEESFESLLASAQERLSEVINLGTGAIEIKSGYGLTVEAEIKMLKVIKELKKVSPILIKSTFLGAHAFPLQYKNNRNGYIDLIINEMLPLILEENLADYVDVFCDKGFFTLDETRKIVLEFAKHGIKSRLHANELDFSGGVQLGCELGSISVDHLECADVEEFEVILKSNTIPTLLPSTAFFLKIPYPKARKMIDMGLGVVLASDYNPGSSPSGDMHFVNSLAVSHMNMTVKEAIAASTLNAAYALELQNDYGSITTGKKANFFITKEISSLDILPYRFTSNYTQTIFINGKQL